MTNEEKIDILLKMKDFLLKTNLVIGLVTCLKNGLKNNSHGPPNLKCGIKPVQLEMRYFICQSFKKRGKCNDKCIYKQFNFCIE